MGNAPAFQLFASDFFMDTISWTVEEVGIYTRLLLAQWTNGPLDNDTLRLSRIAGITHKKFLKWFPKVSQKFQESSDGKVFNLRLEETRQKQKSYIESQQLKGKISAEKRATTVEATVEPRLQPKVSPSSSSSSSSSKKKINNKILYLEFVYLAEEEHQKLIAQFGEQGARERIDRLNVYLGSTGKKYKNHYYTILNWERRNGDGTIRENTEKGRVEGSRSEQPGKYAGIGTVFESD